MNKVILIGRLTKDPEFRQSAANSENSVCRYSIAVDKYPKPSDPNAPTADFINCVTFNKGAEFANKYLKKGMKIAIVGKIQTGSYTGKDGKKVYTTDVVIESQEFVESKAANGAAGTPQTTAKPPQSQRNNDFMNIPDETDEELPF